jgi:hypothetical protein
LAREVTGGSQWSDKAPATARLKSMTLVQITQGDRTGYVLREGASPDARFQVSGNGTIITAGAVSGRKIAKLPSGGVIVTG